MDTVTFGALAKDTALARLGFGGPWVSSVPTPRAGNVAGPWRALVQSKTFLLAFPTQAGRTYTVEFKDNLSAPTWTPLPPLSGLGLEQTIRQPLFSGRFFRVREQ
jgi:hypothetical protein